MSTSTTNYNLKKPSADDFYNVNDQNENMNIIDTELKGNADAIETHKEDYIKHPGISATSGTSKAYTVTLVPAPLDIPEFFGITIIPHVTNVASPTLTINGLGVIALKDQKGVAYATGKLLAGKPYMFRKIGTDFLADSGEGGEYGTATAGDVLVGKTLGREDGIVPGTLSLTGNAVASDVRTGKTFYNTNAKSKLTGTFAGYGVGEFIDDSKIVPPIITPNGTDAGYKPIWKGTNLYTRTAGASSLSNYNLKGQLLNTFTPASLNGGYSVPYSVFPCPNNAYFYFSSSNSYNGEIRYAYALSSGNIGSTPVFAQSGSQNSNGGYFGVSAVAQDGGIYFYDNTAYFKRTVGLGNSAIKWIRFGNAPNTGFYPGLNIITSLTGTGGTIETIRDSDGGTAYQLRWRSDGANSGVPIGHCFDNINSILYILPGSTSALEDIYLVKKYIINPTTGAITASSTFDLRAFYTSVSTDQAYRYSTLVGIFGDKLAIKVASGSSSSFVGVYLIDLNLSTTPVLNTLLTSSMDKLTGVTATDPSGELVVTPTQIYGAGLKYKVVG